MKVTTDTDFIKGYEMSAPWKSNKTTLDKIEEQVADWIDQLNLDEHVSDLKEQIATSDKIDLLREKVPGVKPKKKSHRRRNFFLLLLVGAGVAGAVAARNKAAGSRHATPPFTQPGTTPHTNSTDGSAPSNVGARQN